MTIPPKSAAELPLLDLHGAILDSVADGIFGLTTNGITTFANRAVTWLTGWRPEELIGLYQHSVIHHTRPDGTPYPRDECPIYAVCRHGNVHHQDEDLFWRKDGTSFPVSYTATPLRKNGVICGAVVIFQDITLHKRRSLEERERKSDLERLVEQKTRELRQTNAQLSSVLKAAAFVAIIAGDLDGTINLFNEGAEKMLGYKAEEVIGKMTPEPLHLRSEVEERSRELSVWFGREIQGIDVFTLCAREGHPEVREWTYVRKDGSHVPVSLGITPLYDENGVCNGCLGVAYDISERKRAEAAQRAAVEAAESANRAKSEFLATMSHEIRTPMNGIIGMADLLLKSHLDPVQRSRTLTIRESGDALLRVLNDILDFSKIEAGKLAIEAVPCDLRSLVEGVAELLALKAQEKSLELICAIDPSLVTQRIADSNRLRQILLNLVGNAIKFTHRGHVLLRVEEAPARAGLVRFEVTDTGIGVPPEKQHLLFQRFSQADASTSRQYGGTGLGLSIVAGLVQSMGGEIGFQSEPGQGSCFWFQVTLPLQGEIPTSDDFSLAGKRVLLVDDNAASRLALAAMLTSWGCEVALAEDARSAFARLSRQSGPPFEVFLIDVDMPDYPGDRLCAILHADARYAEIPVILLTPLNQTALAGDWQSGAFVGGVAKPVKQGDLRDRLAMVLGLQPLATQTAAEETPAPQLDLAARASYRLLLVEDNVVNQEVAMGLLEHFGFRADVVGDGKAALRALQEKEYTLVLCDCQMPEMDGYELTRLVREAGSGVLNPKIPIIALTAHSLSGDREKCLAAGMDDFLTKPLKPERLEETITRWLGSAQAAMEEVHAGAVIAADPPEYAFDENDLLDRVMGSEPLAKRVAQAFLDTVSQEVAALSEAIRRADTQAATLAAHSIKGAAASAGSGLIRDLASHLEQLSKKGALAEETESLRKLMTAVAVVTPVIRSFCEREG